MTDDLEDLEALAADYVLGTLEEAERRRAAALTESDPAFARLVEAWSQRLAPIQEAIPPVDPPPQLWHRIEAALPRPAARPPRTPLWHRIGFWRWWSLGTSAVAAAFAFYVAAIELGPKPEERFVAVLSSADQEAAWLVTVDVKAGSLTIRPVLDVAAANQDYELWLIPGPETVPRSLGLLDQEQEVAIPIALDVQRAVTNAPVLAVSLEPAGGSPTGLPTGPVLFQGKLLSLEGRDH